MFWTTFNTVTEIAVTVLVFVFANILIYKPYDIPKNKAPSYGFYLIFSLIYLTSPPPGIYNNILTVAIVIASLVAIVSLSIKKSRLKQKNSLKD